MKILRRLVVPLLMLAAGCGGHTRLPCDATGQWSPAVDGVRARLVSTTSAGRAGLAIDLDNRTGEAIALAWFGYPEVGYAAFAAHDRAGRPLPSAMAWGGNQPLATARRVVVPPMQSVGTMGCLTRSPWPIEQMWM